MAVTNVKRSVGLEIDTGTARAVEFTGRSGSPSLAALGSITLPEGTVKEGLVLEPEQVGAALKQLWSQSALKERSVLLGVSNQGVLVRHITIPKVPADKLKNVITYQAQEQLPIPLDSVVLDYLILGETSENGEAEKALEILLVAARRDMLDQFLEALSIAGLEPLDIDVSSMAMIRLLPKKALSMNVGLVNIANGLNSVLISAEGKPRLARLGMVKLIDLAESLGCTPDEVFTTGILKKPGAAEILSGWINRLAGEIRSSLTYYQDQAGSEQVEGLLLSGRGAMFYGIAEQLEEYLELPVRTFNPLETFSPEKRKLVKTDFEAIEYTISAGLALRGLEG
jgi:type IV pilus assembly protein PilM